MINDIKELISANKIVSFDIFDTLVFRNISRPTDVFKTMNKEIEEKYGIKDFYSLRVDAEYRARCKSSDCEVNLDDIYNCFKASKSICNQIKKMELEREREFICVNPFMKEVFDFALKSKKKIFLISDMYLSSEFIKSLLTNVGYTGDYTIYVSNECHVYKGNGSLFHYVREKNDLSFSEWVHIGDNIVSDYQTPINLGMSAYNYKNVNSYDENNSESVFESIVLGVRNKYCYSGIKHSYFSDFGCKCLMPIYLGFANYVYNMARDKDNLFFLARDGYFIEKIYKLFPKIDKQYTRYLYVSRKSIQLPYLYESSKDRLMNLYLCSSKGLTLRELLESADINIKKEYDTILPFYGYDSFDDVIDDDNYYAAYKILASLIRNNNPEYKKKYDLVKEYLCQEGLDKFDTVNLVDIGWGGSSQDSIRKIMDKEVMGYYLETIPGGYEEYASSTFAFLYDLVYPNDIKLNVHAKHVMMYELIFSAPHGSTVGYEKKKNKIEPILREADDYLDFVKEFQTSSYELIELIMKYYKYYDSLSAEFSVHFYEQFLRDRKYEDVLKFSKITNDCYFSRNDTIPYIYKASLKEIKDKDHYDELYKKLCNQNGFSNAFTCLWYNAYLIKGINNKEDFIDASKDFELYLRKEEIDSYLAIKLDTIDEYEKLLKEHINSDYEKYFREWATIYYKRYNQTFFESIRRKLIPYKLRKIINKVIFHRDVKDFFEDR